MHEKNKLTRNTWETNWGVFLKLKCYTILFTFMKLGKSSESQWTTWSGGFL